MSGSLVYSGMLAQWREALGLSQDDMASLLAVPRSTYIKWERGDRRLPHIAEGAIILLRWLQMHHSDVFEQVRRARLAIKPQRGE